MMTLPVVNTIQKLGTRSAQHLSMQTSRISRESNSPAHLPSFVATILSPQVVRINSSTKNNIHLGANKEQTPDTLERTRQEQQVDENLTVKHAQKAQPLGHDHHTKDSNTFRFGFINHNGISLSRFHF